MERRVFVSFVGGLPYPYDPASLVSLVRRSIKSIRVDTKVRIDPRYQDRWVTNTFWMVRPLSREEIRILRRYSLDFELAPEMNQSYLSVYRPEKAPKGRRGNKKVYINGYLVDRLYGGPEEGGWWYDQRYPACYDSDAMEYHARGDGDGKLLSFKVRAFKADEAIEAARALYTDPPGHRGRGSVIGGPDIEFRVEDHPPQVYPKRRPRYE